MTPEQWGIFAQNTCGMLQAYLASESARLAAEAKAERLARVIEALLSIRDVWTDPHNDVVCAQARAALQETSP